MELDRSIVALLARRFPALWEIVGGGPAGGLARVALNTQPIPPGDAASLNPQPLPPVELTYGVQVGVELVRAAGLAQLLRVAFDPDVDGICPPLPTRPPVVWPPLPWPPDPYPWRQAEGIDPTWRAGYATGLAFALEASRPAWRHLDGADALTRLHEVALGVASDAG